MDQSLQSGLFEVIMELDRVFGLELILGVCESVVWV